MILVISDTYSSSFVLADKLFLRFGLSLSTLTAYPNLPQPSSNDPLYVATGVPALVHLQN